MQVGKPTMSCLVRHSFTTCRFLSWDTSTSQVTNAWSAQRWSVHTEEHLECRVPSDSSVVKRNKDSKRNPYGGIREWTQSVRAIYFIVYLCSFFKEMGGKKTLTNWKSKENWDTTHSNKATNLPTNKKSLDPFWVPGSNAVSKFLICSSDSQIGAHNACPSTFTSNTTKPPWWPLISIRTLYSEAHDQWGFNSAPTNVPANDWEWPLGNE